MKTILIRYRRKYPQSKIYGVELTGELFIADAERLNRKSRLFFLIPSQLVQLLARTRTSYIDFTSK